MKLTTYTAFLAAGLPFLAVAQDAPKYLCTHGELQRRVEIIYETGVQVPCEVHYYKDTEAPGESEVLWRALNEAGYCEARTTEFIGRLEGMGWSCGQPSMPTETQAPIEIDDTEDLMPADEEEVSEQAPPQ